MGRYGTGSSREAGSIAAPSVARGRSCGTEPVSHQPHDLASASRRSDLPEVASRLSPFPGAHLGRRILGAINRLGAGPVEEACGFLAAGKRGKTAERAGVSKGDAATGRRLATEYVARRRRPMAMAYSSTRRPFLLCCSTWGRAKEFSTEDDVRAAWPMVRQSSRFLIVRGPSTGQDRWENSHGAFSLHARH